MSAIFDLALTVSAEHIDQLGHVNNVVYVQWMQDVASKHVNALGLGLKQYQQLNHAMWRWSIMSSIVRPRLKEMN